MWNGFGRRDLFGGVAAAALAPRAARAALADDVAEWQAFRTRFLAADGRVIDTGNEGVSHSEGQGWGLMFAASMGERETFERILAWTQRHLRRPHDRLHAWRYRPRAVPPVSDLNNASDGDIYIVWGLMLAHARWRAPSYRETAAAIARDILRLNVRPVAGHSVLLPGAAGFDFPAEVVLNPSYYAFPAFALLNAAAPDPRWGELARSGAALLQRARFGAWALTPDWLSLPRDAGRPLALPATWPPRFSFDAVRVPLLLAWHGSLSHPALRSAHDFWSDTRWEKPPAWVDVTSGVVADFAASPGVLAIASFVAARRSGGSARIRPVTESADYFSAALALLVRMACRTTQTPIG